MATSKKSKSNTNTKGSTVKNATASQSQAYLISEIEEMEAFFAEQAEKYERDMELDEEDDYNDYDDSEIEQDYDFVDYENDRAFCDSLEELIDRIEYAYNKTKFVVFIRDIESFRIYNKYGENTDDSGRKYTEAEMRDYEQCNTNRRFIVEYE